MSAILLNLGGGSTATPSLSVSNVSPSQVKHRDQGCRMSSRKFSDKSDVMSYRQFFAKRWQAFIVENFDSPSHAAHAFKVDPSTAQNWWEGNNAPQGWVVGRALSDPTLRSNAIQHIAAE